MRRILRKIAENAPEQLGDTSTLADPAVVESLVQDRLIDRSEPIQVRASREPE